MLFRSHVTLPNNASNVPAPIAAIHIPGDPKAYLAVPAQDTLYVIDWQGNVKWSAPIGDTSGASGASSFDFDGHGVIDVVYADEKNINIYNGRDGSVKFTAARPSLTGFDVPVIADVDDDGHAEVVVVTDGNVNGSPGVIAYAGVNQNWVGTRHVWNQHSYHVTNVNENGTIPVHEARAWSVYNAYRSNLPACQ